MFLCGGMLCISRVVVVCMLGVAVLLQVWASLLFMLERRVLEDLSSFVWVLLCLLCRLYYESVLYYECVCKCHDGII